MTEIKKRLAELKPLGAGDAQCAHCLEMKMEPLDVCKKCIADTPAFTAVLRKASAFRPVRSDK
jgi:hypothetical protein